MKGIPMPNELQTRLTYWRGQLGMTPDAMDFDAQRLRSPKLSVAAGHIRKALEEIDAAREGL